MADKKIKLTDADERVLSAVLSSKVMSFPTLVKKLGLDPKKSFRGADLRGVDLRGVSLAGYDLTDVDLTGADLADVDFADAIIDKKWIALAQSQSRAHSSAPVFISYSQRAPEPTHTLAAELVQHGIDAWFDVNLLPGDAFAKVIDREMDRAMAVVTIWSRPALTSTWMSAESQRALDQGKLLCVRTADVDVRELPAPFNMLHTPLVTDIEAIVAGLAAKGVRRGK